MPSIHWASITGRPVSNAWARWPLNPVYRSAAPQLLISEKEAAQAHQAPTPRADTQAATAIGASCQPPAPSSRSCRS